MTQLGIQVAVAVGPQGPPGSGIIYGTVDPGPSVGVDGNFYINTTSHFIFGPKASGAWPAGTSLVGPTGPTGPTGPQGAGSVKATLATTANNNLTGEKTIDGVVTNNTRVLVKNQTIPTQNGVYISSTGAWTRATDFTAWTAISGALISIVEGTSQNATVWLCDVPPTGTVGTDNITFVLTSGNPGTVTNVSVVTFEGVSGSVLNATTTPEIIIKLNDIVPDSVAATGSVTGSNLSGTNTGDQTITLVGPVTGSGMGTFSTTVGTNVISNTNLTQMATMTLKGNNAGVTANVTNLNQAQVTAMLNLFTTSLQGLTPASGGGTSNYLRADGTWSAPPGAATGSVISVSVVTANGVSGSVANATTTPAITLTLGNIVPASVNALGLVLGSNLQGTNTGDQTITLTGDVTGSGMSSFAATIAANAVTNAKLAPMVAHTYKGNNTGSTANAADITSTQLTADLNLFSSSLQGLVPGSGGGTTNFLRADGTWTTPASGAGTVTSVSVVTANGVSGSVANATTTPAITLTLGAITPSSVNASGTVLGSNLSGTNTGDQTITLTGDVTGSGTGSFAATIAANAVTNAKLAQMTAHTYKGNNTGSTANAADITSTQLTADLNLFSSSLQGLVPASGGGTTNFLRADGTWAVAGSGTVTSVSVVTANGVSGSVATATTTPAITLTLGAITPSSVNASGTVLGSNLSGTNTGDQTITLTGDVTGSGTGSFAATIAVGAVTDTKGSLATKPPSTVVATTNQTLSGTPTIDGQATAAGSIILNTAQTAPAENGFWVAAAGAWSRPTWYPSGGTTQAFQFITSLIRLGTIYRGSIWRQTATGPITIDTTATTWAVTTVALNSSTVAGNPFPSKVSFSLPGPRVVQNDCTNWMIMPWTGVITKAWIIAKAGPTGAAFIIDLQKSTNNGSTFTSVWASTPANKLQIAASAVAGNQTSFDTTAFNAGDVFRIDIDQVGSTVAGSDVTVILGVITTNA